MMAQSSIHPVSTLIFLMTFAFCFENLEHFIYELSIFALSFLLNTIPFLLNVAACQFLCFGCLLLQWTLGPYTYKQLPQPISSFAFQLYLTLFPVLSHFRRTRTIQQWERSLQKLIRHLDRPVSSTVS